MAPKDSSRTEKELRLRLECRHSIPADQCAHCRGRTASGETMEAVTEDLLRAGQVVVELQEDRPKTPPRYRNMKTVIGLGLGVTVFAGLIFWQGGKLILRLVKKDKGPKTAGQS